jgi:hypothetical protein
VEGGRLGSHRSVLLNGLGTEGLVDEEAPGVGCWATIGLGLLDVGAGGVGLGRVAARFIAAIAAEAAGAD